MRILVISGNYPSKYNPVYGIFVYNLIQQFAKKGHQVTVISPSSINAILSPKTNSFYGEELCKVFRPKFMSFSNKDIFGINTYRFGEWGQIRAVKKVVHEQELEFDLVYAHFLSSGLIAVRALSSYNKPIVVAEGELRNIELRKAFYKPNHYNKIISRINGFVAVSPQIKEKLISVGVVKSKILVKPNAVDFGLFYKRHKLKMRKKHKLPLDKKLIIFVGRFVHDKGPLRLLQAVENLQNVGLIFAGSGVQNVNGDKIVFKGKVSRDIIPELMSAADLFVLPTLHEGSCNAIVEAMACGLPIVSSDIPEIRVQCAPDFSILVDPLNVTAIKDAISRILLDEIVSIKMSNNAMKASKEYEIGNRANDILDYLEKVVNEFH